jgi:predicted Zn-ribbon and HTH transcriptional regulator
MSEASPNVTAPEATQTVRQRILQLLREEELTAHELSQRAGLREREVAEHLRHLEHTLSHGPERLRTVTPECVACGFRFEARQKHSRPSRCPRCKSERLSSPRFRIAR